MLRDCGVSRAIIAATLRRVLAMTTQRVPEVGMENNHLHNRSLMIDVDRVPDLPRTPNTQSVREEARSSVREEVRQSVREEARHSPIQTAAVIATHRLSVRFFLAVTRPRKVKLRRRM